MDQIVSALFELMDDLATYEEYGEQNLADEMAIAKRFFNPLVKRVKPSATLTCA
eukprot:TRINITY_DN3515_c0_g1_i1.p3 TRINITY_DN3515_c0_g1~~TRINITY_DN3515_c0_g1_i1.p3  ORF type:complete len:54 (-),score=10.05 TRINITY_DN3515_c0_g1_i1:149-310(-)